MIQLRSYQQKLISDTKSSIRAGNKAVCVVSGCGSGKSITSAAIAKSATDKGNRVLFLVHRRELCQQIDGTFRSVGVDMNLCDVCMVQTASRRVQSLPEYQLIITDECHHSTANTYRKVFERFPEAIRIGFTATPVRLNKGGLGEVYTDLVQGPSTRWLIENHFLAPYHYYSVKLADATGLHTKQGDFDRAEMAELMENKTIYGNTVKQWERLAKGKKTIVYCASVEAAIKTAREFCNSGYKAAAVSGLTHKFARNTYMDEFRDGRLNILCNCELFGEGLDIPDCECVVMLRPTQSLSLFIQQSMRSMRYMPGKTAIIIDHVGNCYRHGLPDDEREWSLLPKHKQENTVKIRECPKCFAVYPPTLNKCPFCGEEATHEIRTVDRKTVDIDLVEVARQDAIRNTKLRDADLHTWDEVVEFQKLHGFKFAWCLRYTAAQGIPIPKKYNYMRRIIGV